MSSALLCRLLQALLRIALHLRDFVTMLGHERLAVARFQPVEVQDAVQVILLMLQSLGQVIAAADFMEAAVYILIADRNRIRPVNAVETQVGDAQASFKSLLCTLP